MQTLLCRLCKSSRIVSSQGRGEKGNLKMDKNNADLRKLIPIAAGIVKLLGKDLEVSIHEFSKSTPESSIIHVEGKVTNRRQGNPETMIIPKNLRTYPDSVLDLVGFKTITKDGRILKSNKIYIRNDRNDIIGCFCIKCDITEQLNYKNYLEQTTTVQDSFHNPDDSQEFSDPDVIAIVDTLIEKVISSMVITDGTISKEDKMRVVNALDLKKIFLVKGAVDRVAIVLGVSRYTIYNYLEQHRVNR